MRCVTCFQPIDPERLEVLPDTRTCTRCSKETKVKGLMSFDHKTAPVLVVLPDDAEQTRLAYLAYRRRR